ncbi:MAG TPA: tetratricopeptide repeat protein, partial [Bdellovibrio sp.]|nr:tetratricopeptide repeat protein [Bdellovibrio sp.]
MIRIILISALLFLVSCSSQEVGDLKRAQSEASEGRYASALSFYDRVIKRNAPTQYPLIAAREASRLSFFQVKDYPKTLEYLHFIVLHSPDEKERLEVQKQIAAINFNNLQNYQVAIVEYSKLQQMHHTDQEAAQYKMNLARAHYYLNNFFQAESEIDGLLKLKADDDTRFSALMLKGNILVGKKEYTKAADIFKSLIANYPEKSMQENVGLTLAVCYEENS